VGKETDRKWEEGDDISILEKRPNTAGRKSSWRVRPLARFDVGHVIGKESWEHTIWVEREYLEFEDC
jgi:hypothetical protein